MTIDYTSGDGLREIVTGTLKKTPLPKITYSAGVEGVYFMDADINIPIGPHNKPPIQDAEFEIIVDKDPDDQDTKKV